MWRYPDAETPSDVRECTEHAPRDRYLEYLRGELRAERISYGERYGGETFAHDIPEYGNPTLLKVERVPTWA